MYGSIFENFLITEIQKHIYNNKLRSKLFFYRGGNEEVDLMVDSGANVFGIEVKAAETYSSNFLKGLKGFQKLAPFPFFGAVFYNGSSTQAVEGFEIHNVSTLKKLMDRL